MKKIPDAYRWEKGQTLVETALVLPLVFVLLLGILEFGRILIIQQALTSAAREGVRQGAIHMDDAMALTTADAVATDYLTRTGVNLNLTDTHAIFLVLNGSPAIEVQIDYAYTSGLIAWVPGLSDSFSLQSRAVMRREA